MCCFNLLCVHEKRVWHFVQYISRTGRDSPPTPRKSNGKSHGKKTVIEKKQAVKGFVMRTMVRAATGIEDAKRNWSRHWHWHWPIAENLKSNGKVQEGRDQTPRANIKFVKLWDLSRYSERTTSKRPTCQKWAFRGKLSLWYHSPV